MVQKMILLSGILDFKAQRPCLNHAGLTAVAFLIRKFLPCFPPPDRHTEQG